nr:hypothetical protein [Tanacetum cinerariifolium]
MICKYTCFSQLNVQLSTLKSATKFPHKLGNDIDADDADIRPIYDEEPMAKVQLIADNNVFATGQQHTEQPEFNNKGEVDQNAEQCHNIRPLLAKLTDNQIAELSHQSLETENICLKKTEREYAFAKPHHVIAPGLSRYSSNDMVHKYYLEEARKKTQERSSNSKPREDLLQLSARFHGSNKTTKRYKPVEQISIANELERHIPIEHRFSIKKTSTVHEKTMTPRSCLRWKPTGRIFKTVGLRWVTSGKISVSSTTKVNSKPPHGSNTDITNLHECIQNLNSSACTSINAQEEQTLNLSAGTPLNLKKEIIKAWIKENVISRRPRLHEIALIQEISARPSSQEIQSLLTS